MKKTTSAQKPSSKSNRGITYSFEKNGKTVKVKSAMSLPQLKAATSKYNKELNGLNATITLCSDKITANTGRVLDAVVNGMPTSNQKKTSLIKLLNDNESLNSKMIGAILRKKELMTSYKKEVKLPTFNIKGLQKSINQCMSVAGNMAYIKVCIAEGIELQ